MLFKNTVLLPYVSKLQISFSIHKLTQLYVYSFTMAMASLSPVFSNAWISGDSKLIIICFIPCLSKLQANLQVNNFSQRPSLVGRKKKASPQSK